MDEVLTLEFDGGSRGNPGPAGIGVVVRAGDGTPLVTLGRFIGRATNNVAEYRALITALQQARELGAKKIVVRALTFAAAGTPERVPALPASPFSSVSGAHLHA